MNRFMDLPQTVSLINQERSNNKLYVSLVEARPTVYYDDKTLPSLPASVLNVMQADGLPSRAGHLAGNRLPSRSRCRSTTWSAAATR